MKTFFWIILPFAFVACRVNYKLDLPLRNGQFSKRQYKGDSVAERNFFLIPNGDYTVRSAENAVVEVVGKTDSNYFVIMQGKYTISYMHLDKINIKKGDTIERGKVFGEVLNIKDVSEAVSVSV